MGKVIDEKMVKALEIAAAAQGIPPEAVGRVVGIVEDLNAVVQTAVERNFAQATAAKLASVEALKRLGQDDAAKNLLDEVIESLSEIEEGEDDGDPLPM